jgi:hypothetical protein
MSTFEATFYLNNFHGVREVVCENENGEEELCIAIPIERNALVKSRTGKWMTFGFMQELDEPRGAFTHQIKQKTNPAHVRWLESQGLDSPFIARLKPTKFYHRKRVRPTGVRVDKID